jgi:flagellar biosynthesis protein FliR
MLSDSLLALLSQPLWVFLTALARVSPVLMLTPPMTSASVPMRVRALLAISIALLMTPLISAGATAIPGDLLHVLIGVSGEVLLGLLLGSVILMAVVSLQLAGQSIGHLAGFEMATAMDPSSNEDMPVVSNMLGLLATAFLLLLGGHRQMMGCAIESFVRYPAGGVFFETHWLDELQQILSHTFVVGIRAAAPLAVALLLSNVVTSLLARTLPQLNILSIGFSINVSSMLLVIFVSLGSVGWVFQSELATWLDTCHRIILPDT